MSAELALPSCAYATLAAVAVGSTADVPEIDRLSRRATAVRRATFVAGRRAARLALERRWGALPEGLRVEADTFGRPEVRIAGRPSPTEVSITHAAGWAVAAAAEVPIGLDLVELAPLPAAMLEDVFDPDELADLGEPCLAFAAKEAALKWLGVGMNVPLRAVRVAPARRFDGRWPWRVPARVTHPRGRADLELAAWRPSGDLVAALLGPGQM